MEHIDRVHKKLTEAGYNSEAAMHILLANFGHDEETVKYIINLN